MLSEISSFVTPVSCRKPRDVQSVSEVQAVFTPTLWERKHISSLVTAHLNISLLQINFCCLDFPFERITTSAWGFPLCKIKSRTFYS